MPHPDNIKEAKRLESEEEQLRIDWQALASTAALADLRRYLMELQDMEQDLALAEIENPVKAVVSLQKAHAYANILAYIDDKLS